MWYNMKNIYEELNVKKIINAAGMKTRLGGTLMHPEVIDAMHSAAKSFIDMEYLQSAASKIISEITGAEAGFVSSGAAAGLTLSAAACIAKFDPSKMDKLPNTNDLNNEIIIPRSHRNTYDHAYRAAGAILKEAGVDDRMAGAGVRGVENIEIEDEITDKTVAIAYTAKSWSSPSIDDVVKIANKHDLPLIVDAAAEIPPLSNLNNFIKKGASLVVFSGGKALRGPQCSGIICGKKDLISSAAIQCLDTDIIWETWNPPQNLIDKNMLTRLPRNGIGRGFKVGKEEIVGLLTALKLNVKTGFQNDVKKWMDIINHVHNELSGNSYFTPKKLIPEGEGVPLIEIKVNEELGVSAYEIVNKLKILDPPIHLSEKRGHENILTINPSNLNLNETNIILDELKNFISR